MLCITLISFATWLLPLPGNPRMMTTIWKEKNTVGKAWYSKVEHNYNNNNNNKIIMAYPVRSSWSTWGFEDVLSILSLWFLLHTRWCNRCRRGQWWGGWGALIWVAPPFTWGRNIGILHRSQLFRLSDYSVIHDILARA